MNPTTKRTVPAVQIAGAPPARADSPIVGKPPVWLSCPDPITRLSVLLVRLVLGGDPATSCGKPERIRQPAA